MVINNDPCYAYLLSATPWSIRSWSWLTSTATATSSRTTSGSRKTNRKMMDEMANHATRVWRHIERHGYETVEAFIDVCLSLENLIDPHAPFMAGKRRRQSDHWIPGSATRTRST
jgi:stage V sporulation protein R